MNKMQTLRATRRLAARSTQEAPITQLGQREGWSQEPTYNLSHRWGKGGLARVHAPPSSCHPSTFHLLPSVLLSGSIHSHPTAQGCLWSPRVLRGQDIFLTSEDHMGVHVYVPARVHELRDTWEHRGSRYTGTPAVASRKVLGHGGQRHKSTGSELDPSLSGLPSFTWE